MITHQHGIGVPPHVLQRTSTAQPGKGFYQETATQPQSRGGPAHSLIPQGLPAWDCIGAKHLEKTLMLEPTCTNTDIVCLG